MAVFPTAIRVDQLNVGRVRQPDRVELVLLRNDLHRLRRLAVLTITSKEVPK